MPRRLHADTAHRLRSWFAGGHGSGLSGQFIDLPPTLLDVAGIGVPGDMHGRSLLPLVNGRGGEDRDAVFMQISEAQCARAIRTRRWTYSVRARDADGSSRTTSDTYYEDCLYDNDADPHQHNNLVANRAYEAVRADLKRVLLDHMRMAGEKLPEIFGRDAG